MSGEQQVATEEATASFMAGFDEDENAHHAPAEQPTETPAAEASPEPTPEPTPAPKYVQITEDEWNDTRARAAKVEEIGATWGKRFDQAFGKMGGLERKLAEITAATPQGEAVAVNADDFAELKDQYPELGELTIKGLNKVLGKIKTGSGLDEKTVNERVEQATAAVRAEMIDSTLNAILDTDDWAQEVKTPAYLTWQQQQPADVLALAQSAKLSDAAKLMRLYAKAKNAPAATPTVAATPAAPQTSSRQRQLAAAVMPKGEGGSPPPSKGKSPFLAAFEEDD